jgi:hypothetical protein
MHSLVAFGGWRYVFCTFEESNGLVELEAFWPISILTMPKGFSEEREKDTEKEAQRELKLFSQYAPSPVTSYLGGCAAVCTVKDCIARV